MVVVVRVSARIHHRTGSVDVAALGIDTRFVTSAE